MHPVLRVARGLSFPLLLLLVGCQTGETLTLDATNRPAKEPVQSYSLLVKDPAIETDTLRHQEAERLVKTALSGNGFYEASDPDRADMAITIDYGIGPGRAATSLLKFPVYRTEARSHLESVLIGTTPDGREIYSSVRVDDSPEMVQIGEDKVPVKETVYDKRLLLQARRARPDGPGGAPDDLWAIEVISTGTGHNLRQSLPVLTAVALEHMGEETDGPQAIRMTDGQAIEFVKNQANASRWQ